jgi:hypothetical protein
MLNLLLILPNHQALQGNNSRIALNKAMVWSVQVALWLAGVV